jgi:hypothetical protein
VCGVCVCVVCVLCVFVLCVCGMFVYVLCMCVMCGVCVCLRVYVCVCVCFTPCWEIKCSAVSIFLNTIRISKNSDYFGNRSDFKMRQSVFYVRYEMALWVTCILNFML